MNRHLMAEIEDAIDKVLDKNADKGWWSGLTHPALTAQMAEAAALVFDATMDSQEFIEREK